MKAETFFSPAEVGAAQYRWIGLAVAGVTALALLAIYWSTSYSIYSIWDRSGTFAHGFVVIPIFLWLLWRDREALQTLPTRPWLPAVAGVALAGFAWLAAQLSTVPSASQFALLFMVQLSFISILGLPITRRLAFPLAFLFFAIPFGEFMLPGLMDRTADATVVLLKLSGVPVYREADHLQIPTGNWTVVEACSGLRYLVASLMAGTLFAYLRYRSPGRRLMFIAASIAVPLVANWLRAYGIVLLGHLSNNKLGTNVDHLIYGWVFFGFVMALLFWIGSLWEESPATAPASPNVVSAAPDVSAMRRAVPVVIAGLLCILVSGVWPPLLRHLDTGEPTSSPALSLAEAPPGWTASAEAITSWEPRFVNPSGELSQQFMKNGHAVGLYIAYYRNQRGTSRLVSTENALVSNSDPVWKLVGGHDELQPPESLPVRGVLLIGRSQRLAVREWFWVDGHYTGRLYVAAARVLLAKLAGHGDDSAAIVTYTPVTDQQTAAAEVLDAFASDMAPSLSRVLDSARLQR